VALAPAIAALVAIGGRMLWARRDTARARLAAAVAVAVSAHATAGAGVRHGSATPRGERSS
jgi:hypothetical protein